MTFAADEVILDCRVRHDYDEPFEPATAPEIRVHRQALPVPLGDLGDLLIFHNVEMPDEQP
ncbi:hypothetical protein GCM10027048_22190 [Hymenobacter coalescens]